MKQSLTPDKPKKLKNIPGETLERITDAFVALDENWCYTYMNRKAGEILNCNPGQMIGRNIWNQSPESINQPFYLACYKAFENQEYMRLEVCYPPHSLWIENHIYPSPEGVSIFFKDITGKKKAEQEKEKLQRENEALINSTTDLLWSVSNDYTLIAANSAFINGLKENGGYLIKPGDDVLSPEYFTEAYLQYWNGFYGKGLAGEKVLTEIYTPQKNSSELLWFELKIDPIFIDDKITGIACFMRNITERKKKEEEKYRLSNILQKSLDEIYLFNAENFHFEYANEGALKNLGYTAEEIYTLTPLDIKPDMTLEKVKNLVNALMNGEKEKIVFETIHRRKDNSLYPVEVHLQLIEEKGRKIFLVITREITERKKTEAALIENEERYRTLVENAPEALVVVDVDRNKFVSVSESAVHLFKMSRDEMLEVGPADISPEYQPDGRVSSVLAIEKIIEAVEGGRPFFEWTHCDSKGKLIPCEVRLVRLPSEKSTLVRGSITDITDRKMAEDEIRKSNERFELIARATNEGLWDWNLETNHVWGNEIHQQLYGLTLADPVPGHEEWKKRIHPEDRERVVEGLSEALASELKSYIEEYRFYTGEKGWINIYGRTLIEYNREGKAIRLLGSMSDITESKKAEIELKESEEKFRTLVQQAAEGIFIVDQDGNYLEANDSAALLTGYSKDELKKMNAADIVPEEELKRNPLKLDEIRKGSPVFTERIIQKKDGTPANVEISAKLMDTGKVITVLRDITQRKIAEQQLKDNEERLRLSLQAASQGLYDVNVQTGEAIVNDQYALMLGYDPATFVETNTFWLERLHPDDLLATSKAYRDYVQGKTDEYRIEFRQRTKDNTWKWILSLGKIIAYDTNSRPIRMLGTHTDISKLKEAEQKIIERENLLRTIYNTEPECIKLLGSEGELMEMNPAGLAMIEADNLEQVKGKPVSGIINEPYRKAFINLTKNVFKEKSGQLEFEITGLKGTSRWLETHAVPLKNTEGKIISLLGVTRDISQRKKAEAEILKTTEQLRQLTAHLQTIREEERKRIAREIHDELGQQLTAIKMDVAWIDKKTPEETAQIKSKLKNIIGLLDGSNQSIRRILSELRPDILDHQGLMGALEWQGQQFTKTTGIPIEFTFADDDLKLTEQIATCIFRVYQEALTNIMRHAQAKKVITSLNSNTENIIMVIEDDGKGFHSTAVNSKKSFGILGMKERLLSLNGKFELISLPGKGTKIVITIPVAV